jgi:hypothetical protein
MGATGSRSLRYDSYVRMQHFVRQFIYAPFRRLLGDVRREFLQRPFDALHGTLGPYLPDALHEGSADGVACLPIPRGKAHGAFPSFSFYLIGGFHCFL